MTSLNQAKLSIPTGQPLAANVKMNSKRARDGISTKKYSFLVGFRDEKVLDNKNLDHLVSDWLMIWSLELGSNDQPIDHQIIHGPSSYQPKLSLHQNRREINVFCRYELEPFSSSFMR